MRPLDKDFLEYSVRDVEDLIEVFLKMRDSIRNKLGTQEIFCD